VRTSLRKGKVVFSSPNHGVSLVRDFTSGRLIRLGKYGNSQRRKINSLISYMNSSFNRGNKNYNAYHPFPNEKRLPPVPPMRVGPEDMSTEDKPIPIECEGLVLASQQGYWVLKIDPLYSPNSKISWLGNNPGHECIKLLIGSVTRFNDAGCISGLPARWAFQERMRKFTMPTTYSTNNLLPYRTSVVYKNPEYLGVDSVSFAHYGYSIPMEPYRNDVYSMAFPGGVYGALSYKWFSHNFLLMVDNNEEFSIYDTIGWDAFKSSSGYFSGTVSSNIEYGCARIRGLHPPEECATPVIRSGNIRQRALDTINAARMCDYNIQAVLDIDTDQVVALAYATEMATYSHFSHTGFFGSTLEERAEAGGLTWSALGEVLALIDDPGLVDPDDNLDAVVDEIIEAWETSPIHWDSLMSQTYFRFSCAAVKNLDTNKWYACGLLRALSTDERLYNDAVVTLAVPPPMAGGVYEEDIWQGEWIAEAQYSSCRGFCTVPVENPKVVNLSRRIWKGYIVFLNWLYASVQDNFEYPSDSGILEGGITAPTNSIEYADALEEYQLHYYNGSRIRDHSETVNFYYQYSGTLNRDIYVELAPLTNSASDTPDFNVNTVPEANRTDNTGNCTLHVGSCVVDNSQRGRFHGLHCNPYQTITVAGIFHSNSGYTVIVYSMPETLYNDYLTWEYVYSDGGLQYTGDMYQRYYKVKQSLWCAVVLNNTLIARWELKGQQEEETELYFWPEENIFVQIDPPQQDFIVNFNGIIEKDSVNVECLINDTVVVFTDAGDGTLTEQQYQIEGEQYLLASSTIDYDAGVINYTFGSLFPEIGSNVITKAHVSEFSDTLLPFEATTEIICESFWPGYNPPLSESYSYFPVSFNTSGVFPAAISGTITEDGHYVVISLSLYDVTSGVPPERYTSGGYAPSRYINTITFRHNADPPQVLVYDLTQKDEETSLIPKLVNLPFYLTKEKLTETVVLN